MPRTESSSVSVVIVSVVLLVIAATAYGVATVKARTPHALQVKQQIDQNIERQGREAAEECAKSPGCDPTTRRIQKPVVPPEVIPARR